MQPFTLTGVVEQGVEHGSVVLRTSDGTHWQVGRACAHLVGRRVRVVGRPRPGVLTTAMQGTPFAVATVERLDDAHEDAHHDAHDTDGPDDARG